MFLARSSMAQLAEPRVTRVDLSAGRSFPLQTVAAITKITVANPEVADAVVVGERDVVINGRAVGETDVLLFTAVAPAQHYRITVHTPADRPQIALAVKLAEVRRTALTQFGISQYYLGKNVTAGSGTGFNNGANFKPREVLDSITLNTGQLFTNVLGFNNARDLYGFIEAQRQRGDARILAEPTLLAADRDSASFLAGGELPIPIAQPTQGGASTITITYREFGVRLSFTPEVLSDSIIRLRVRPEVSTLDFDNGILIQGFRVPALTTRRVSTTVDVRRDQALVISGLFNEDRQKARTGVPFLMDIPILGNLFSSTRWQRNETELIAVVTPSVFDPIRPRPRDNIRFAPDTTLPARDALEKRLPPAPSAPATQSPARRP